MMMTSSEFLTDQQLAERWHIHRKTLIRWRTHGLGPDYTRIEGRVLYALSAVKQFEQFNTITHTEELA